MLRLLGRSMMPYFLFCGLLCRGLSLWIGLASIVASKNLIFELEERAVFQRLACRLNQPHGEVFVVNGNQGVAQ